MALQIMFGMVLVGIYKPLKMVDKYSKINKLDESLNNIVQQNSFII